MPPAVEAYFAAINDEDWSTVAGLFAHDAELRSVGAPTRRGRDAIAAHFPRVLAALPEHHDEPIRVVAAGDVVLVEIHFSGRTTDGAAVEFDAVDVFDLEPGGLAIARLSTWYDTAAVARMVAPGRRSAAELDQDGP